MTRPCQQCGRAANYAAKRRHYKACGRNDHDLCRRCWAKLMEAANVADREAHLDRASAVDRFWAAMSA